MARYSKIQRKFWTDGKVRRLSPIPPCGQGLALFLLSSPDSTPIPGLIPQGPAAIAERLGWSAQAFREAFKELEREGIAKADFDAQLVFLPNAIRYNAPASPNVVRSWAATWDELPECELKQEAWSRLQAHMQGMSKAFQEAFREACPKPSGMTSANQEQEQEQEQEKTVSGPSASDGPPASGGKPAQKSPYPKEFEETWAAYPKRAGNNPKRAAFRAWNATKRREGVSSDELLAATQRYHAFCKATGKIGDETVMRASTFYGPDNPWQQDWAPPAKGTTENFDGKHYEGDADAAEFFRNGSKSSKGAPGNGIARSFEGVHYEGDDYDPDWLKEGSQDVR